MRSHGRPVAILTTLQFHRRSRFQAGGAVRRLDLSCAEDAPEGVETIVIRGAGETMIWLPRLVR